MRGSNRNLRILCLYPAAPVCTASLPSSSVMNQNEQSLYLYTYTCICCVARQTPVGGSPSELNTSLDGKQDPAGLFKCGSPPTRLRTLLIASDLKMIFESQPRLTTVGRSPRQIPDHPAALMTPWLCSRVLRRHDSGKLGTSGSLH